MALELGTLKTYVKDQVRRNTGRITRPIRIAKHFNEYNSRRKLAEQFQQNADLPYDLATLKRDGYLLIAPEQGLLSELLPAARKKLADAASLPARGGKKFFSSLLGAEDYSLDTIFMRFALHEPFLKAAAHYLGVAPFLEYAELLYSKPSTGKITASQQWHRDRADVALIKIFVYIDDVGPRNGPFTFIPRTESSQVPDYLTHYLSDEQMQKYVPASSVVEVTGPAGTTFMIDSENCYHQGSRCEEPRLAYVVYYNTGFSYQPRENAWHLPATYHNQLSELQRYALGLK